MTIELCYPHRRRSPPPHFLRRRRERTKFLRIYFPRLRLLPAETFSRLSPYVLPHHHSPSPPSHQPTHAASFKCRLSGSLIGNLHSENPNFFILCVYNNNVHQCVFLFALLLGTKFDRLKFGYLIEGSCKALVYW